MENHPLMASIHSSTKKAKPYKLKVFHPLVCNLFQEREICRHHSQTSFANDNRHHSKSSIFEPSPDQVSGEDKLLESRRLQQLLSPFLENVSLIVGEDPQLR
jgi:hypothetical protein